MTSEDLWTMEQHGIIPDMSNPTRQAEERPLDTVRRISMRMEHSQSFYNGLPGDVICKPQRSGNILLISLRAIRASGRRDLRPTRQVEICRQHGVIGRQALQTDVPACFPPGIPRNSTSQHARNARQGD